MKKHIKKAKITGKKLLKVICYIFVVSFFVHLFWEVAHSFLYNWNELPLKNDIYFYIPRIIQATIGDGILMVCIYFLGLIKNKKINWVAKMKRSDYTLVILAGFFMALFVEEINVFWLGRWSYTPSMPLIPFFNVGLTPILQLLILPIFIFKIIGFFRMLERFS